ncbi:MAG: pilus assembly PilX family protein [Methylophilaceae bacterium]
MKTYKNSCVAKSQQGLVLFIALVALVAMSLAAAALIRSVDSGVLVAGNLAFKQSAILSAETGIARAYRYINENSAILETQNANGYFAVLDDAVNLTANNTWTSANSVLVEKDISDLSGNETRFILQRMCRTTGAADEQQCLVGTGDAAANSKGGRSEGGGAGGGGYDYAKGGSDAVVYRATVRVAGPKNTFSYLQAFIY